MDYKATTKNKGRHQQEKHVFFQALPELWGEGVYPCPDFLALFFTKEILVATVRKSWWQLWGNPNNEASSTATATVRTNGLTLICPRKPTNKRNHETPNVEGQFLRKTSFYFETNFKTSIYVENTHIVFRNYIYMV